LRPARTDSARLTIEIDRFRYIGITCIEKYVDGYFDTWFVPIYIIDTPEIPLRIFAYLRTSTAEQMTENQAREVEAAGFQIDPKRIVAETVSGSTPAMQRKGFAKLMDRLEASDILVVTKMDRLGRNAMDVRSTVEMLDRLGVRVHCLQLGGVDLTSPSGKMTMAVINAVAEFERELLIERTQSGLRRAKAQGKSLGRPPALNGEQQQAVRERRAAGVSLGVLAREYGVSRAASQRIERRSV